MNNKGIVMEITDKSIIVMRPDGKFDRVSRKKRNCEIGEEIEYAETGINWRSPSVAGRSAIAAAVVFCLVLFASFNGKLGSPEVIAYVSMDINPSIEMGIDIKENVLELRGLNTDGDELIQNIPYKGAKLEEVASRILDKAEQKSLAKGEAEIVIASTVVHENDKVSDTGLAAKLQEQVTKHIEKTHPAQASSYQVAAFAAPQEVRQAAAQNGVSMGKYTVYLNAKNSGAEVTLDEIKKQSVLQLSKEKPEIAKVIQSDAIPSKADIKKLVEEEKSGQLDKKLEEKLKEKKDNGKASQTTGSQPGKNDQTGQSGPNNQNNPNNKNGQNGQTNPPGQQNGKTDPKKTGSTNGSSVPANGKSTDKNDDKKDDRKDNKPPSGTKPGTTGSGSGTVRPGDKSDDRKNEQEKKNEDDRKQEEAKKNEEQRRKEESDRRLEEQKKKAEEQKKEQDKKDQDKKDQDKKDQDKKDQGKKDDNRKPDDSKKKDDGKDDDKSKGDGKKQ